nr:uncharacterized protein LOC110077512 isoform X2 [Pogona vitticeps]
MYIPVRSCHRELRTKYGEFYPPKYLNGFEGNIWCNWTVWAGSRKNIIIYISGFKSDEGCDKNENKIFFHGVSSVAENTVVYACWGKETHVFATYAKAVHVISLTRHPNPTKKDGFVGKYYIFQPREARPDSMDPFGSAMPSLELVLTAITSIPQAKEASLLFTFNRSNAHISESLEADNQTVGLLETSRKSASITAITGSARKSKSLHLLSTALKGSENSSCTPNPSDKLIGVMDCVHWRMNNGEIPVGLGESTTSSNVVSDVSYVESGLLTEAASPVEDMGHPSRLLSSPLGLLMNDYQWMKSKLTQQDYLAMVMPSLMIPSSMVTTDRKSPGSIIYQSFGDVQLAMHEAMGRGVVVFGTTSLSSLGHTCMGLTSQNDYLLVPAKTQERGKQESKANCSILIINYANSSDEREARNVLVLKSNTELWDIGPVTETFVELTNQPEAPLATALPSSVLEVELNLRPGSSYHEQSSTNPSLNLASEMPRRTDSVNLAAQSIFLLDIATKQEPFLSPSKTTTIPLVTAELGLSCCVVLRVEDEFSLPALTLKPSLFHSTETTLSLTLPVPEPISFELEHALSPSMTVTYPSLSVRPHQTLPVSAILQKSVLLELEPGIFSARELDVSLNAGQVESIPLGLCCAATRTATTLQEPFELEDLSPAPSALEPRSPEDFLPAAEASFFLINEVTPSLGLQMANTIKNEMILSCACSQDMASTPRQEDPLLIAGLSSGLYSSHHAGLEHQEPLKQLLLGEREDNCFGATSREEGEKGDTAKPWNIISKPKLCFSLDRFTLSSNSVLNHSVLEMPLVSLPAMSKKKQSANITQYDLVTSSTIMIPFLPQNEMQTPPQLPVPLEVREEGGAQIKGAIKSWGELHNAKWQWGAMECIVADLDAPGTLTETSVLWDNLDLLALQGPSSLDNKMASKVRALLNCRELGFPWLQVYLPVKSCHVILKNKAGTFSPPILSRSQTNNWCNWTIWAGSHKHILIYIEGFEGNSNCEENQDKIIFQGVSSSVESKIAYSCRNHNTLIFAAQAVAVHVVFLSKSPSQNHSHKHFKGRYFIFEDYEMKEPVSKSNSSAGFPRKSDIMHSGHILDFLKTNGTPSNDSWLPVTTKKSWKENGSARTSEAVVKPTLSNYTQVSFMKSEENVTSNPLAMKAIHVANPSVDDIRTGNESSSGNLKKMLGLGSNSLENEEKPFVHDLSVLLTSTHVSQKLKMTTKSAEWKDHETTTESARLKNGGYITTHLITTYSEAVKAMFGKVPFKSRITFPQVLIEEQRTPTLSPKSILEKGQNESFQSNSGLSRKNVDVTEYQQGVRLREALERQHMDNQVYRQEKRNSNEYMVAVLAGNNKSQLITETPQSSTNQTKPQQTTLDYPNVLHDLSLRALNHNLVDTATTLSPQGIFSRSPKHIKVGMTEITHPNSSVTRYREQPQRKYTRANPPYSPSVSVSRNNTSLNVGNISYERESVFRDNENDSVLLSQHNPGDLLFEIVLGIERKEWIPPIGSNQEKALIEFIKRQVQGKVRPFSNQVKEIKLKEIKRRSETSFDRQTDPDLMLMFWLHLTPKKKNVSYLVRSQLENLSSTSMEFGKVQTVLVTDVNECSSGIGLCGDEAICLNGYGTYLCKCKEDYEDRSETKSGTLCIRSPRSGLGSLYTYTEILVGTTVFFISALVVVISVLCTIIKKRHTKKGFHFQEAASPGTSDASELQQTTFDQNNIHHLLTLDPTQLKLRAKAPEWPLEVRTVTSETYRVSIEQSDYL